MSGYAYGTEQVKPDALPEWGTREAEDMDIYGAARPQGRERISTEDATLIGGFLAEEVREALRTGYGRPEVAEACRAIGQSWAMEAPSLPIE